VAILRKEIRTGYLNAEPLLTEKEDLSYSRGRRRALFLREDA